MQDRQGSGNESGHESAQSPLPDAAGLPSTSDSEGQGLDAGTPAQQAAVSGEAPAEQVAASAQTPAQETSLPAKAQEPAAADPGLAGNGEPGASDPGLAGNGEPGASDPGLAGGPEPAAPAGDPGTSWIPGLGGPAPVADAPGHGQPGFGQPGFGEPGHGQPGFGQPGYATPGYGTPGYGTPGYGGQGYGAAPGAGQPGPGFATGPEAAGFGSHEQGGQPGPGSQPGGGQWGPPPAWPGQPGGASPAAPQASWASPPSEQGPWTVLPGGQAGGWGPPPGGGYGQPVGSEPPQRSRRTGRAMIYVLVAALAAALGAGGVLAFQHHPDQQAAQVGPREVPLPQNPPSGGSGGGGTNTSAINEHAVAAKVEPGIVDITSFLRYTGQVFEGTGMVLDSSGLVLTNNHVVNGSTRLRVTIVTTGKKYDAQIVGTDAADDVALLKLVGASGLKTVQVGNSEKVTLGTPVVALGNAGGTGGLPTVTSGSITALHRSITASDAGSASSETLRDMLQTNAPIAEGDSGGPLANASGQVVGMDTAANTQSLGGAGTSQGFAIPINRALTIARDMAAGHASGSIRLGQPAFIGIAIASSKSSASNASSPRQQWQQLQRVAQAGGGVNSSNHCMAGNVGNPVPAKIAPASSGTLIAGVFCDAPASSAGLAAGDVITAVNGHAVSSPSSLTKVMSGFQPGNTVSVTWVDTAGHQHSGSLKLAAGPAK